MACRLRRQTIAWTITYPLLIGPVEKTSVKFKSIKNMTCSTCLVHVSIPVALVTSSGLSNMKLVIAHRAIQYPSNEMCLRNVWPGQIWPMHYNDVIMGSKTSQITSLTNVYSTVYSDADQRKHQSSASLAFVRGIHRRPVNSSPKWPVMGKIFPFDDVIMDFSSCLKFNRNSFSWNSARGLQSGLFFAHVKKIEAHILLW